MELLNGTKMVAGYSAGMRPDARELLVVVVKGTFTIPELGKESQLAKKQVPLIEADKFTGEPGFSSPLYESEYAPRKLHCDVLFNGSAYAPGGIAAERVTVALQVGRLRKSFDVVGNRTWTSGLLGPAPSKPEPFTVMPFCYDTAFGGVDRTRDDPQQHRWYLPNPFGRGYYYRPPDKAIEGKLLPNTEESGRPIKDPSGDYRPMALGPIARVWQPRRKHAGTYDQQWLDNVFPFLPADFDERYYQAAPEDQQTDYLQGGEELELANLTADGLRRFHIPKGHVPVEFFHVKGGSEMIDAVADTLLLEPDKGRFTICWRASIPLKKNLFEIRRAVVGRMSRGWYHARKVGKAYYPSLRDLISSRKL